MPYDPETGVAEGLVHILDLKVGRRQAGVLLHDHLEKPEDGATMLELVRACRAKVSVRRGIDGERPTTRVAFKTKVGDRQWDGDSIEIPAIPMTLALGAVGRPLNSVIGHPLLPPTPIADSDADPGRRLTMQRRDVPMRELRPAPAVRALTGLRRMRRRARLARHLHAHYGWTPGVIALSVAIGLLTFLLVGLPVALARGIATGDHVPDIMAGTCALIAAIQFGRTMAGTTVRDEVVRDYVEKVTAGIMADGHPGSDDFEDGLTRSS